MTKWEGKKGEKQQLWEMPDKAIAYLPHAGSGSEKCNTDGTVLNVIDMFSNCHSHFGGWGGGRRGRVS